VIFWFGDLLIQKDSSGHIQLTPNPSLKREGGFNDRRVLGRLSGTHSTHPPTPLLKERGDSIGLDQFTVGQFFFESFSHTLAH